MKSRLRHRNVAVVGGLMALIACGGTAPSSDQPDSGAAGAGGSSGTGGTGGTGTCSAGSCLSTLASNQKGPLGLAVDSGHVYWTQVGGLDAAVGTVKKVGTDGGTPVTLATGQDMLCARRLVDGTARWQDDAHHAGRGGARGVMHIAASAAIAPA